MIVSTKMRKILKSWWGSEVVFFRGFKRGLPSYKLKNHYNPFAILIINIWEKKFTITITKKQKKTKRNIVNG